MTASSEAVLRGVRVDLQAHTPRRPEHPLPERHRPSTGTLLRIARISQPTAVLGPGDRSVVYTQGCALRCSGCLAPESHERQAGLELSPEEVADRLLAAAPHDGVTFSGGDPVLQPQGLTAAIRLLRVQRPKWTFMAYTGYRVETLLGRGAPTQLAFLRELDILIDGPFVARLGGSLCWRGSSNQRVFALTDAGAAALVDIDDRSAGIELTIDSDGLHAWTGVPPDGFAAARAAAVRRAGLVAERVDPDLPASPNTTQERGNR